MDRKSFLDALCRELKKMGADDAVAAAQRNKMDIYLQSHSMDAVDVDPAKLAEGIMQKLKAEAYNPAARHTATTNAETNVDDTEDPLSALNTPSHRHMTVAHEVFGEEPTRQESEHHNAPSRNATAANTTERQEKKPRQIEQAKQQNPPRSQTTSPVITAKSRAEDPITDPMTDPEYYQNRKHSKSTLTVSLKEENKTLFWIIFCIAVPLGAILCTAAAVAFLGMIALLVAVAIGFVAALIAVVAVGCSIALIGIIYGLYKIVSGAVPIGLYEVGLGITVGSSASFIGILMYNIAIRLVPFLMKKLTELISFGFRKARDGFVALKGALEDK